MVHKPDGSTAYQPYGIGSEANYSISRGEMNKALISLAEDAGVEFVFGAAYDADASAPTKGRHVLRVAEGEQEREVALPDGEFVFACDGAGSRVRAALEAAGALAVSKEPLSHGYKEVIFPLGAQGEPTMRTDALHIWPRGHHMLMTLANLDGSFTGTVYLPNLGKDSFEQCAAGGADGSSDFMREHYSDAAPLLDDAGRDVLLPLERGGGHLGALGTVRVSSFAPDKAPRVVLLGDAAHAIVPFFGQGCNCGFEDVATLDAAIATELGDGALNAQVLVAAVRTWAAARKPNADAIADMALENFWEMQDKVGDEAFLRKKALEHAVEEAMPLALRSRYAMVTSSTIPYATCFAAGKVIEEILAELNAAMPAGAAAEDFDRALAARQIEAKLAPLLLEAGVGLEFGGGAATTPHKRRVGILGYGHLGQHMVSQIAAGAPGTEGLEVAFVWNRSSGRLTELPEELRLSGEDLSVCLRAATARKVDVVVEVAHPAISAALAAPLLRAGVDFVVGSPTALAAVGTERAMREASASAESGGLYIPSGALWGAADLQSLSNRGGLAALTVTMKKHPASFRLTDAVLDAKREAALQAGGGEVVLYEGPVRGLCPLAPNNVNTMAAAALAASSLGFDGAVGRLVADASLVTHEIEIDARGPKRADGSQFSCVTRRSSPAPPGAVTSKATYGSFLESLVRARGRGKGLHMV